jgi:L-alanine-DL-glutamate epimerase-like enolase superfamily enzyme
MKITDVTVTLFAWTGIPATTYHAGSDNTAGCSTLGLVRISTDAGIEGHAFLGSAMNPGGPDSEALIRFLKPLLVGQDALAREHLHRRMIGRVRYAGWRALGACDVALWDIAGKAAGLPLHRLFGTCRDSIIAYASSQLLDSPEAYAQQALQLKNRGWRAYKIHPPQSVDADIAACKAVRAAVGDDFPLMLDASWSYGYEDALRLGRAVQKLGFLWYEDPLADQDLYGYVKLRQKLDIPILATEFPAGSLSSYTPWITERATDMLRGDIPLKGGLTGMLKTAHTAEAFGLRYEIHHGGNSVNNYAQLHLACAIPNTTYFEVLLPDGAQKYGVTQDIEIDADGRVHPPSTPGIGAPIDLDIVENRTEGVLR